MSFLLNLLKSIVTLQSLKSYQLNKIVTAKEHIVIQIVLLLTLIKYFYFVLIPFESIAMLQWLKLN